MSWAIGYDERWKRDIGYGVPATCDHPKCTHEIDRGLSYVCGGEPYGGEHGCGLYFCQDHLDRLDEHQLCARCSDEVFNEPFPPKPDLLKWTYHKMTHESWADWRVSVGLPRSGPLPESV